MNGYVEVGRQDVLRLGIKVSAVQRSRVMEQLDALAHFHAKLITGDVVHCSKKTTIHADLKGLIQEFTHNIDVLDEITQIVCRAIDPTDELLCKRSIPYHYDLFDEHIHYWVQKVSHMTPDPWHVSQTHVFRTWSSLNEIVESKEQLVELLERMTCFLPYGQPMTQNFGHTFKTSSFTSRDPKSLLSHHQAVI